METRTYVLATLFLLVLVAGMHLCNICYTIGKPCYFLLTWCHTWEELAFEQQICGSALTRATSTITLAGWRIGCHPTAGHDQAEKVWQASRRDNSHWQDALLYQRNNLVKTLILVLWCEVYKLQQTIQTPHHQPPDKKWKMQLQNKCGQQMPISQQLAKILNRPAAFCGRGCVWSQHALIN